MTSRNPPNQKKHLSGSTIHHLSSTCGFATLKSNSEQFTHVYHYLPGNLRTLILAMSDCRRLRNTLKWHKTHNFDSCSTPSHQQRVSPPANKRGDGESGNKTIEFARNRGILVLITLDIPVKNFDAFWVARRLFQIHRYLEILIHQVKKKLGDVVNRNMVAQQFLLANELDTNTKSLRGSMMGDQPFISVWPSNAVRKTNKQSNTTGRLKFGGQYKHGLEVPWSTYSTPETRWKIEASQVHLDPLE